MALLREVPPADAVDHARRTKAQRDIDERATAALHRRLNQLEAEHTDFQRRVVLVGRAVRWPPDKQQREQVRARLDALDGSASVDPFRVLRIDPNGHERQPAPVTGRGGVQPDPAVQDRRRRVAQLRAEGLTSPEIAMGSARHSSRSSTTSRPTAPSRARTRRPPHEKPRNPTLFLTWRRSTPATFAISLPAEITPQADGG